MSSLGSVNMDTEEQRNQALNTSTHFCLTHACAANTKLKHIATFRVPCIRLQHRIMHILHSSLLKTAVRSPAISLRRLTRSCRIVMNWRSRHGYCLIKTVRSRCDVSIRSTIPNVWHGFILFWKCDLPRSGGCMSQQEWTYSGKGHKGP